jgi:outer membrane protein OmpA-like peptidoglycan-associated protein
MHRYLIISLLLAATEVKAQPPADTFHIHFALNSSSIDDEAAMELSSLQASGALSSKDTLTIMGYADMLGNTGHNDSLSSMRAQHVKEYLIKHNLGKATFKLCTGKGAIKRNQPMPAGGFPEDRKVDVIASHGLLKKQSELVVGEKPPFNPQKLERGKAGDAFTLDKIYFYRGRHTVRETSIAQLEELYRVMAAHPGLKIKIEGHICCVPTGHDADDEDFPDMYYIGPKEDLNDKHFKPDPKYVRFKFKRSDSMYTTDHYEHEPHTEQLDAGKLSENRAWRVYQYLVDKGIDPARMSFKGFGSSRHAVVERDVASAEKNMRVELVIVEN